MLVSISRVFSENSFGSDDFAELADAPRPSLLRVKAASDDTSASGDEIIEDLKGKVRTSYLRA